MESDSGLDNPKRELHEPLSIVQLDRCRMQMHYVSQMTGDALPDRFVRWPSRDYIVASAMCWGSTVFTAEVNNVSAQS